MTSTGEARRAAHERARAALRKFHRRGRKGVRRPQKPSDDPAYRRARRKKNKRNAPPVGQAGRTGWPCACCQDNLGHRFQSENLRCQCGAGWAEHQATPTACTHPRGG